MEEPCSRAATPANTLFRMPGPKRKPRVCRQCGASERDRLISKRKLCVDCSIANMTQAVNSIAAREGAEYDRWVAGQRRYARSIIDAG